MRAFLCAFLLVFAAVPVIAQSPSDLQYKIEIDKVFPAVRDRQGTKALFVTVQFRVKHAADGRVATNIAKDEIVVEEDRQKVAELEIYQPRGADKLTTVLALDNSGSMGENNNLKMNEAKRAAGLFLDKLHEKADTGLILFNHEILQPTIPPVREPPKFVEHRKALRRRIDAARAEGGTAYLDATAAAIEMLVGTEGRKANLLLTDGVDLNSKKTLKEVIELAQAAEVPVYTLGVGEPGKNEPVTSVLVLDQSGSMRAPADDKDRTPKYVALQRAATRFVDIMRTGARTTLLPFSDKIAKPKPFSNDKEELKAEIARLKRPSGGTLLYDATLDGIMTLEAARPEGKRAVVVLTDGVDEFPGSRHTVEEVIEEARRTSTPLHMLGLGRENEINKEVMQQLANAVPGGSFHHVRNMQELLAIFEKLSIDLHDDGIDEASLRALAEQTGGKYFLARDVSQLQLIYSELAEELQSTYTATFPSRRSAHDGTARGIDISVVRGGKRISDVASADYNVHGVVVAEMDYRIYLIFLGALGGLLLVPSGIRNLYRLYGGT
jgi:VWFA-related protein